MQHKLLKKMRYINLFGNSTCWVRTNLRLGQGVGSDIFAIKPDELEFRVLGKRVDDIQAIVDDSGVGG